MVEKHFYEQSFKRGVKSRRERRLLKKKKNRGLLGLLIQLLVAIALAFGLVQPLVVKTFYVPSESMIPTLKVGDRVFANKFIYRFSDPERGDIVVFKSVEGGGEDLMKRVVAVPGDEVVVRNNGTLFVNGECWEEPYINHDEFSDDSFSVPEGKVVYELPDGSFSVAEGKKVFKSAEDGGEDLMKRVVAMPGDELVVRNGVLFVNGQCWLEPYINDDEYSDGIFGPTTVPEGSVFVMGDNRGDSRDSRSFGPVPIENIEGKAFVIWWTPSHISLL